MMVRPTIGLHAHHGNEPAAQTSNSQWPDALTLVGSVFNA